MTPPAPVLHAHLPLAPWMDAMTARLPGLQPLGDAPWLVRDEAFAGQMALRDALARDRPGDVHAALALSEPAPTELLAAVLAAIGEDAGYSRTGDTVRRPDGVTVDLADGSPPLILAARLAQEDFAILLPADGAHILVAACICFPASWTLAQKIGRPMLAIHEPVARYDAGLDARIARVLASLRPGEAVWRANFMRYNDPALYQPRLQEATRRFDPAGPTYMRVERQTLSRLPQSGAVVFTIHTLLAPWAVLTPAQQATCP